MSDLERLQRETDDIARGVGRALSTWTIIETRVTQLFLHISSVSDPNKGYLIIEAIVSFDARLKIVTDLIAVSNWPKVELEMWRKLAKRIRENQSKRNELAHFMLVNTSNGRKTEAVAVPYFSHGKALRGESKPLRLNEITQREKNFREIAIAVAWFGDFASRLGLSPPISPPVDTELIKHLRELTEKGPKN